MTYTLHYHDETGNVTPKDAEKIIKRFAKWQEQNKNPADGSNRFGGVAYDHDRNGLRITAYVEEITETKAPEGIKQDFDELVNKANDKFETDFTLPSETAEIKSRG